MQFPPINRKIAFLMGYAVLIVSLLLLNLPRYLEIKELKRELGVKLENLRESYEEYMDQKKTLDLIKTKMKRIVSFDDIKRALPAEVSISRKGDRISIEGIMSSKAFNDFMDFITRSSNVAVYSIDLKNTFSSPFVVDEERKSEVHLRMEIMNPEVIE